MTGSPGIELTMKRGLGTLGFAAAWLVLGSALVEGILCPVRLHAMSMCDPGAYVLGLLLELSVPVSMFACVLVFEIWASMRSRTLNVWPVVALTYMCIASSLAILLLSSLTVESRQQLLEFRRSFTGPIPMIGFACLLGVFGFYAAHITRQTRQMPFTLAFGRWATYAWIVYFSLSRLWMPVRMINRVLETMR